MLLTLRTTHRPATDLGYLLGKNPARLQSFELSHGRAHVFYPVATEEECTAALLLEVDPVGLVRGKDLEREYVNDRPYAASSFLAVAIADVFRSGLAGNSRERQALADTPIPLEAKLPCVPCRGGEGLLRALFEPLGYAVEATRVGLDPTFPDWGASPYWQITLKHTVKLSELLAHLYVLLPVLDDEKHYFVGDDEVRKLVEKGEGWLATHPERKTIANRYLKHRQGLVRDALARIADTPDDDGDHEKEAEKLEVAAEAPIRLDERRIQAVRDVLAAHGAKRVLDLGCGEGKLVGRLLSDPEITQVTGVDASLRALEIAARRLRLESMPPEKRARVALLHGALTYRDARFAGYDAIALVEVIEHVDEARLPALEHVVFAAAKPPLVVVTTPNAEHNVRFPNLGAGRFRHADHRFEWTRAELAAWAERVAKTHGYQVEIAPIGDVDAEVGAPTQMAIFVRGAS